MIYNGGVYNEHWDTKKLNELGDFSRGRSTHRPRNDPKLFSDGKYPLVQTGDITAANLYVNKHTQEYSEFGLKQSKLWRSGTLCITIAANIAEAGILSYPMCFPDSVVGFTAFPNESSEIFMYYVFEYIRNSIKNSVTGSIQDNINIEYLKSLNFKIPKKNIQDRIIKVLFSIDQKIELNKKINETLQEQASDIYMHLFFRKTKNGKLSDILIEHEKSTIQVGEAKNIKGNYPFFTSGQAIFEWTKPLVDGRNCFLNTGGNADVKFYVGETAYSTDTWCVSGKNQLSDYLYLLLDSIRIELNQKFFQGTGLKHLQKELLKNKPIYIPNENEANAFNKCIQPIFNMVSEKTRENQELTSLRDWLLPMLMNGQAVVE